MLLDGSSRHEVEIARISAVQMLSEGFPPGGKRAQRPQAILRVTLSIEAGGGAPPILLSGWQGL